MYFYFYPGKPPLKSFTFIYDFSSFAFEGSPMGKIRRRQHGGDRRNGNQSSKLSQQTRRSLGWVEFDLIKKETYIILKMHVPRAVCSCIERLLPSV